MAPTPLFYLVLFQFSTCSISFATVSWLAYSLAHEGYRNPSASRSIAFNE
jgi:hypothetical protein